MQDGIFFSEAKKGYNKEEVQAFLKRLDAENRDALQSKADEYKKLLNEKEAMRADYAARISALEEELAECRIKCEESTAKYDELCARMGEKLLFAEQQAAKITADAEAEARQIKETATHKAEQHVAAISAQAREEAATALRAADLLRQKGLAINIGLDGLKKALEDALSQIEKATGNA